MYKPLRVAALVILFLTTTLLFNSTAIAQDYAQSPDIIDTLEVEQISITAQKLGSNLEQAPISTSKLTSKDLILSSVQSIKDATLSIPNLFMPDYGTKLTSPIYIRGVGSRINSPSVGLYVDGIPYLEKSAFDFNFSDINLFEVLRGPQGTLYGRNTMGGIINITTKDPLTYQGTEVGFSYGSWNSIKANASHYHNLSDYWGVGLSLNYKHQDGYFVNTTLQNSPDLSDEGGARLKLRYNKDKLDINITSSTEYSYQNGYPYMRLDATTLEPQPIDYNMASHYRRFMTSNGVYLNLREDNFTFTSRTSYQYTDDHQGIDQDFSPSNAYYINQKEKHNIFFQELQFSSTKTQKIEWLAGVSGFYQSSRNTVMMDYLDASAMPGITTDKHYSTPKYGVAAFGQGVLNLGKLAITLGARYDIEFSDMEYQNYMISSAGTSLSGELNDHLSHQQFTPKFSLEYSFTPYNLIYGSVTKGFKAGGFNTSFDTDDESSFLPEESWNYEVGGKLSLLDNRLNSSVALFYIDWQNQQVYQPLLSGTGSLLRNAASSYSAGAEFSIDYQIISGLNIGADYGYTKAQFVEYTSGVNDYSGNYLPYIPQNTVAANIDYTINPRASCWIDSATIALQYNGIGRLYWNDSNANYQDFYSTLNARFSVTKNIVTFALWCKNITSSHYSAFYFEALGNSYVQESLPIHLGFDLSLKF